MSDSLEEVQQHPMHAYIDVGKTSPTFEKVSSQDIPYRSKLYRGCRHLPLKPLPTLQDGQRVRWAEDTLTAAQLGSLLADLCGLARIQWMLAERFNMITGKLAHAGASDLLFMCGLLSPIPSGGGCFPGEVYLLVGAGQAITAGVYHYDPIHHALDVLYEGPVMQVLQDHLAQPGSSPSSFALAMGCCFWKDAYKYGAFSYRLQSLDLGVMTAQCLEVMKHYRLQGMVNYQFLDRGLNHLLGLDEDVESIYTVIMVYPSPTQSENRVRSFPPTPSVVTIEPQGTYLLGKTAQLLATWPVAHALHLASVANEPDRFRPLNSLPPLAGPRGEQQCLDQQTFTLDLYQAIKRRHSARNFFKPGMIRYEQFIQLLLACNQGYSDDIDGQTSTLRHVLIYCVVNTVENLKPGIYCYSPAEETLTLVQEDDAHEQIRRSLAALSYRTFAYTGLYLFPVGNYEAGFEVYGDRWYRVQNMEAGVVIQRLYLAAAALGLGCHTSLSYPVTQVDRLLQLPEPLTTLAEVLLAHEWVTGQCYELPIDGV